METILEFFLCKGAKTSKSTAMQIFFHQALLPNAYSYRNPIDKRKFPES